MAGEFCLWCHVMPCAPLLRPLTLGLVMVSCYSEIYALQRKCRQSYID